MDRLLIDDDDDSYHSFKPFQLFPILSEERAVQTTSINGQDRDTKKIDRQFKNSLALLSRECMFHPNNAQEHFLRTVRGKSFWNDHERQNYDLINEAFSFSMAKNRRCRFSHDTRPCTI